MPIFPRLPGLVTPQVSPLDTTLYQQAKLGKIFLYIVSPFAIQGASPEDCIPGSPLGIFVFRHTVKPNTKGRKRKPQSGTPATTAAILLHKQPS